MNLCVAAEYINREDDRRFLFWKRNVTMTYRGKSVVVVVVETSGLLTIEGESEHPGNLVRSTSLSALLT